MDYGDCHSVWFKGRIVTEALDIKALNDASREAWDRKADFWDDLHGDEGNATHRRLVSPSVERLLALKPGERILDISCGTGVLARRMALLGAQVTAVDFSPALIERAKARAQASGEPIDYRVIDATDEEALIALGIGEFDGITCTMALMDMPVIAPLYHAVRRLLRANGRFVFAVPHPAFNSSNPIIVAEREERDGKTRISVAVKIENYLNVPPVQTAGAGNDPAIHYYYHRPLYQLLGEAFDAGFVLDGLEEPGYSAEDSSPDKLLSWRSSTQLPPVLAARLLPKTTG